MNNEPLTFPRLYELGWVNPPLDKYNDGFYLHNGKGFMVKKFESYYELYVKISGVYLPVTNVKIQTEEDLNYYINPIESVIRYGVVCIKGVSALTDCKLTKKEIIAAGFKRIPRSDDKVMYHKQYTGERLTPDEFGTSWVYTIGFSERKIGSIDEFLKTIKAK